MDREIFNSFISQGEEYSILFRQLEERSAVHAWLITGEKGTGKHTLAGLMSAALLCTDAGHRPCGQCRNCLLAEKKEHPDLIMIEKGSPIAPGLKKDRSTIPVEDIREMIRLCAVRSIEGNPHVVLIFDADRMTAQAQNCLLKTLEEPPEDTYIILTAEHPEALLTTVISRCRLFRMKGWEETYIRKVLESRGVAHDLAAKSAAAAEGSVGRALELSGDNRYWEMQEETLNCFFRATGGSDVVRISSQWKDRKNEAEELLGILERLNGILLQARFSPNRNTDLSMFPEHWRKFSATADFCRFAALNDALNQTRKQLRFSVNFQAVLEKLIYVYIGEGKVWLQQ